MKHSTADLTAAYRRIAEAYIYGVTTFASFASIALDGLTNSHTMFRTFSQLVNSFPSANCTHFPVNFAHILRLQKTPEVYELGKIVTMATDDRQITAEIYYAELDLLALAYDMAQEARGDNRRAFRY